MSVKLDGEIVDARIGALIATDTLHEWIPRDPYKAVVCGRLDHVAFFHPYTAEYDWDIYLDPAAGSEYKLFSQDPYSEPCVFQQYATKSQDATTSQDATASPALQPNTAGTGQCISGEVTAPTGLRLKNPWFNWKHQTTTLIGQKVCVFGPWVSDDAHGSRPEIHPVNAIWWKSNDIDDERWLVVLQDASGRFARSEAFRGARGHRSVPWLPTTEVFRLTVDPAKTYRVEAIPDGSSNWFSVVLAPDIIGPALVHDRPFTVSRNGNAVTIELGWPEPRCAYCGAERYLVVRVTAEPEPHAKRVPPASLEPAPPAEAAQITERPMGIGAAALPGDVSAAFLRALGPPIKQDAPIEGFVLRAVREWQLEVEGVDPNSLSEWTVDWQVEGTRILSEAGPKTRPVRRIRVPMSHGGPFRPLQVNVTIHKPNRSDPENKSLTLANYGLEATKDDLLRLLDYYVPLCGEVKWRRSLPKELPTLRLRAIERQIDRDSAGSESVRSLESLKHLMKEAQDAQKDLHCREARVVTDGRSVEPPQ